MLYDPQGTVFFLIKNELFFTIGVYLFKPKNRRPQMKIRKKWFVSIITVAALSLVSTNLWAGSKQQHRWEGVAIGIGAAIVGSALINHHGWNGHAPVTVYHSSDRYRGYHHRPRASHYYRWNFNHLDRHHDWRYQHKSHRSFERKTYKNQRFYSYGARHTDKHARLDGHRGQRGNNRGYHQNRPGHGGGRDRHR